MRNCEVGSRCPHSNFTEFLFQLKTNRYLKTVNCWNFSTVSVWEKYLLIWANLIENYLLNNRNSVVT